MLKKLLFIFFLMLQIVIVNAQLATWDTGSNPVGSISGISLDAGISAGSLSRGAGLVNGSGASSYNSRAWTQTDMLDDAEMNNDFLQWSVTVNASYNVTLNSIQARIDRSDTGPPSCVCKSSTVGFPTTGSGTTQGGVLTISASGSVHSIGLTGLSNLPAGTTVTFRLFCYGAGGSTGTLDIENSASLGTDVGLRVMGSTILPIKLSFFKASPKNKKVLLNWRTETEENNDYMAIERSTDGKSFKEIGRVKGVGTTYEPQTYSFIDEKPIKGVNYYRLHQFDYDGQNEYHKIVSVDMGEPFLVDIFPNPAKDVLRFRISDFEAIKKIQLFDLQGRLLRTTTTFDGSISLKGMLEGTYLLVIDTQTERFRQMIIKQ